MYGNLKQALLFASFAAALAASGCATTDLQASFDGNGGGAYPSNEILAQMATDSEAGGE